jgi:deoxyadenosine/deoxycytidine kinase
MSRLKKWSEYSQQEGEGIRISERSLLSDRYVFASIMKDMKILDEAEHEIYLQCYEYMQKIKDIVSVSGIIYIKCSA